MRKSIFSAEVDKFIRKKEEEKKDIDKYTWLTTKEAAALLHLSCIRVREIKDRLPHMKMGKKKTGGRLLFRKEGLLEAYVNG